MYTDIIDRRLKKRFVVVLVIVLLLTALVSTGIFYLGVHKGLGENYAQKISTITRMKSSIAWHSFLVYSLFALIAAGAISIASILFTHRIAGPLVRVRASARRISEGDLDVVVRFRDEDGVTPLADALNSLSSRYKERHSALSKALDGATQDVESMRRSLEQGEREAAEEKRKKILERVAEIRGILSGIRV